MKNLKLILNYLLCQHIIEPFRAPVYSWKKKGTRAWCFWLLLMELGMALVVGYATYLLFFDFYVAYIGKVPRGFSSFGLFSLTENFDQAAKNHAFAIVATILMPLHRLVYDAAISLFYGGMVETCEDEWPCEPEGRLTLSSLLK